MKYIIILGRFLVLSAFLSLNLNAADYFAAPEVPFNDRGSAGEDPAYSTPGATGSAKRTKVTHRVVDK